MLLLFIVLVVVIDDDDNELFTWLSAFALVDYGVILPTSKTNSTALRNGSLLVTASLYNICNYMYGGMRAIFIECNCFVLLLILPVWSIVESS